MGGHELQDYDCNWSGVMFEHPKLGKVLAKSCKDGYAWLVDVKTGKPIWIKDILTTKRNIFGHDPRVYNDLVKDNWPFYPSTDWNWWSPGFLHGTQVTDWSYHDGTIFHWSANVPVNVKTITHVPGKGTYISASPITGWNGTVIARDAVTGNVKWTWFYGYSMPRSPITVSGGMVWVGTLDGILRFFDEKTGRTLREMNLGGPMVVTTSIGANSKGESMLFTIVGSGSGTLSSFPRGASQVQVVPGTLVGIGLRDAPKSTTMTVTTTATTTSITTATTTATSSTTATTTVTTTSAVTTTATTTSATTATTTLVSTQPAKTTTVTSEITQTTGLPSEVTYAAIAIAIVAIIAAAVLVMRKK